MGDVNNYYLAITSSKYVNFLRRLRHIELDSEQDYFDVKESRDNGCFKMKLYEQERLKYKDFDLIIYQDSFGSYAGEACKATRPYSQKKEQFIFLKDFDSPEDVEVKLMDCIDKGAYGQR